MSIYHRRALANIRRFDQLIAYLRDEMGWPIARDSFEDVDDLFYDFTAEELGIDPKTAAKIQEIKRLRPLSPRQPWGIFFVKFEPKKLPIVALRRILSQVALKRRASANSAERTAWAADDLLFVSNYGEGDERQISFAHFSTAADWHDLPTLKVLGWDNLSTALHLDAVAKELTQDLAWPDDDSDIEGWRRRWRQAFTLGPQEVITTSKELSIRLADLARAIRDRIKAALAIETERGPLTRLMKGFQEALVHDLDPDGFADMYAQTITYGLLSARITDPKKKTADDFAGHMQTNPFLRELMETFLQVGGRHGKAGGPGIDFDELGVSEVVQLLDDANMGAVVRDFGDRNPQEDPVIRFYEDFLRYYDPGEKKRRGVFYTPRAVVSYIVRGVDELLRAEFGLQDGLADTTRWGEIAKRLPGLKIPTGVRPSDYFVAILDPAVGTGTFLVEAIDVIYRTLVSKWKREGHTDKKVLELWNAYVPEHLLQRLYGYELLMAPYAIAHLKVGLKLHETGYRFTSPERVRIYLTNALEPPDDTAGKFQFAIPALANEAQAVNRVKRSQRFTAVLGNPPYAGVSSNRNQWIEGLLRGEGEGPAATNYYEADGESLGEKKLWLQDDYVKFIRLSHYLLAQSSVGVHGMITNHSYLDSPTCRGMRFQMLDFFSSLNIVDLHGSSKRGERPPSGAVDENVFDIMPGVAIALCAAAGAAKPGKLGNVRSYDLWGTRTFKSDWLLRQRVEDVDWNLPSPAKPYYLFVEREMGFQDEYLAYPSLKEIFPFYGTGIQTSRDDFASDIDRQALESRLKKFFDLASTDRQVTDEFALSDTRGWTIKEVRRSSSFSKVRKSIVPFLFRTFDKRWIALTKDIVDWPRLDVMSCVSSDRLGLICSRQQSVPGFHHALAVNLPVDMFCLSNKSREGQTLFPLFVHERGGLFNSPDGPVWRPNLDPKIANSVRARLSNGATTVRGSESTDAEATQAFNCIYATLYSPEYRSRYTDLLKMDYPRVPFPADADLFGDLSRLGQDLVALHLLEAPMLGAISAKWDTSRGLWRHEIPPGRRLTVTPSFKGGPEPVVSNVGWSDETVWIDANKARGKLPGTAGSVGFRGVPESVWNFHIGGYRVCEKWLRDRRGRTLTADDITHYERIVVALSETIRLMGEIDAVIERHGGWPDAFE
jgi:hypothetical protein